MDTAVSFSGAESPTAYLNNAQLSHRLFGYPRVPVQQVIAWTADWVMRGGESLGRRGAPCARGVDRDRWASIGWR